MASGISGAGRLHDDVDYSRSHRTPPAVPSVAYNSTTASRAPEIGDRPIGQSVSPRKSSGGQQQQQQQIQAEHSRTKSRGQESGSAGGRARKASFGGLLARRPSVPRVAQAHSQSQLPPDVPSSPQKTGGTYLHYGNTAEITSAATGSPQYYSNDVNHNYKNSTASEKTSLFRTKSRDDQNKPNMLRKASKAKAQQQADYERQQHEREVAAARPPPRLPSIQNFHGDETRPDSVAIFSPHAYPDPQSPPQILHQTQREALPSHPANFSRPGMAVTANMHSNNNNNAHSSSPSYAVRGASASASPPQAANGDSYDVAVGGAGSMTNRGRYSVASTAGNGGHVNSPRRVRRRKDPTSFNVLVIGTKNSGKSSFVNFLKHSLALPSHKQQDAAHSALQASFTSHYLESEIEGERIGLTLWDSPGLEPNIVDLQLRDMTAFVEAKFEDTFKEEQKVQRSPGFKDTHIHCVFLVLDPVRLDANVAAASNGRAGPGVSGGLDEDLDLQTLRALWGKTTVIPIISKADTLTIGHMNHLKRAVWESIKTAKLNPLDALELDEDDEDDFDEEDQDATADSDHNGSDSNSNVIDNLLDRSSEDESFDLATTKASKRASQHARQASQSAATAEEEPYIPMSILSPDPYDLPPHTKTSPSSLKPTDLVRRFAWGTASPFNPQHCDYVRLRDSIFAEWRGDLRELSRTKWYEQWRTSRLRNVPGAKMRLKGGVTPVAAVPREGRTSPQNVRNFSAGPGGVPRSVSGMERQQSHQGAAMPGMAVSTAGATAY